MDSHTYNCLVVDDEPIARRIMLNYIAQMPSLQLAAQCINALTAIEYLRTHQEVDILFLDINMPHLSGLQLLKILEPRQPVIFTTAYSEFAVESYELNAADYLLKPFSFDRFAKGVYKAIDAIKTNRNKV
ncbi:MAG: response regulator, partial [Pedobacter sp.]